MPNVLKSSPPVTLCFGGGCGGYRMCTAMLNPTTLKKVRSKLPVTMMITGTAASSLLGHCYVLTLMVDHDLFSEEKSSKEVQ